MSSFGFDLLILERAVVELVYKFNEKSNAGV